MTHEGGTSGEPLIDVVHFADPWCWWSWGLEPVIQRLKAVYGDQIKILCKMGGITDNVRAWRKEYEVENDDELLAWISDSNSITGMPVDPHCYLKASAKTTWPACVAVKAAQLQSEELGERFYRRLMETILLDSRNGSEDNTYLQVAREVGLDVELMKREINSGNARALFMKGKNEMEVSFLTLVYINNKTGRKIVVDNTFSSAKHEEAIEKLTGGKLTKKTPVDILEYFEHHQGDRVFPKELAEVFATSPEDAETRLKILAKEGIVQSNRLEFGATAWRLAHGLRPELTIEQVKASHVSGPTQVVSESNLSDVITNAVKGLYTQVATNPHKAYHFPLGRQALLYVGYPKEEIDRLPETALESFAGVGYPHASSTIKPGDTVLDIGSGSGTDVLVSSLRTGPAGKVFGLDITDAMIEKARANIAKMGAKNVKIIKGDAAKIPLDDESVDVVSSNGVLNLVPDKKGAFKEIYRVLKPGGRIQIADIVVKSDVQKVCGLIPQLWADCIGGAAVEGEYIRTVKENGFTDARIIKRLDYFAASSSENTRRLTKTFGAESVVIAASKPR